MATTFPTWGSPKTIDEIKAMSSFGQLHPVMQERVLKLIKASGGKVGLGIGFRSESAQRDLFLSRYVVDTSGPVQFDGKRWRKKNSGDADAAPPGRSMHELGLAADLAGDHRWVVQNSSRFSLLNFAFVNNEPWHVQPFELPKSRAQYEREGSPWKSRAGRAPAEGAQSPKGIPTTEVVPGMRGPIVGQLQQLLIKLGLIKDTVANRDEFYGPATQAVIRKFQARQNLAVDGRVGPRTWEALLSRV